MPCCNNISYASLAILERVIMLPFNLRIFLGHFIASAFQLVTSSGATSPRVSAEPCKEEHPLGRLAILVIWSCTALSYTCIVLLFFFSDQVKMTL